MTVSVTLPATGWYELGLDPGRREALIAAQYGTLEVDRDLFASTLTTLADYYSRQGCAVAAVGWDPASGEPPHAVILISLRPWTAVPPGVLADRLAADRPGDIGPREVQHRQLPLGPAVRVRLIADGGADQSGRQVVTDVVQYWLPLADRRQVLIAAASTAVLAEGDRTAALLDELVAGLTIGQARVGRAGGEGSGA